jgi:light-regulated signal transduction histidine kinase (bacteriophytochrome)
LESANAELEAFSYSVSHDLRAPLRHIDGFSRILSEDYSAQLPQEGQRILERIRAGTAQMGNLIDELLQLGRLGRTELNLQVTGLEALALEARAALEPEAAGREIEWRIAKLPFAACDAGLMRQVFTNLFSNAVKYTRPRPKAVIEVGETRMPEGTAIFVRDNGVGFSMKYADKLFGVFQRLHRSQDFEGTGVGLAAVARIIRRHGGRIWAEAELDRGATFYFTLAPAEERSPVSYEINSGAVTVFANGARYEARS